MIFAKGKNGQTILASAEGPVRQRKVHAERHINVQVVSILADTQYWIAIMKKLLLLFILQAVACCLAVGQQFASAPARVVTSYALTSAPDMWASRDPSSWRLLASNDGLTWDQLDVRTGQRSTNKSARKLFHISNQKAYRIYRLEIDGNVVNTEREVGLAEIELMGPVVGVDKEAGLRANITSSEEQPVVGAAVNAFDGDITTKWIDFAPLKLAAAGFNVSMSGTRKR
jgi:hypothetical protein